MENEENNAAAPDTEDPAKKKVRESFEVWKSRVTRSQKCRKDWEEKFKVEKLENYFLGNQLEANQAGIVLNHFYAIIKTQQPNLFYTNPRFFVRAKPGKTGDTDERSAAISESLLNSVGDQDNNLENAGRLATLQNFFRIGVLKACYDPKLEPNSDAGKPMYETDDAGEPMMDPTVGKIPMKDPATGEIMTEPEFIMSDECYRWDWVDAKNILLPSDGGPDMSKWRWIGEEVVVTLEEAKDDTRFDEGVRSQLVANETVDKKKKDTSPKGENQEDKDIERIRYFEIYDLIGKKQIIFAEGQEQEEFLVNGPLPEGVEDSPYSILPGWTPIIAPEPSPWPFPHVYNWMEVQKEYNTRRNQMMEGAKRSARKGVFEDGVFENADDATKLLQNPEDMVFVKVTNIDKIKVLESPDLNQSIYKDLMALQMDMRLITGQSGAKLADPDSNTATEATFVERASNLRDVDMQRDVNRWLSTVGKKMLKLLKATLTLQKWVNVRGFSDEEFKQYLERVYHINPAVAKFFPGLKEVFMERFGQEQWLQVTREKLQFEAEVNIVPGSSRPPNLEVERGQWMQFLQVLGGFPQLALSRELLRYTASKFEAISERMVDELAALAQQMIAVNANQAGHAQGGAAKSGTNGAGGGGTTAAPDILSAIGVTAQNSTA